MYNYGSPYGNYAPQSDYSAMSGGAMGSQYARLMAMLQALMGRMQGGQAGGSTQGGNQVSSEYPNVTGGFNWTQGQMLPTGQYTPPENNQPPWMDASLPPYQQEQAKQKWMQEHGIGGKTQPCRMVNGVMNCGPQIMGGSTRTSAMRGIRQSRFGGMR